MPVFLRLKAETFLFLFFLSLFRSILTRIFKVCTQVFPEISKNRELDHALQKNSTAHKNSAGAIFHRKNEAAGITKNPDSVEQCIFS